MERIDVKKVEGYVPKEPFKPSRIMRILRGLSLGRLNPELQSLESYVDKHGQASREISKCPQEQIPEIISAGQRAAQSRESGMALGFLFPNYKGKIDRNTRFGEGFVDGQVYALKSNQAGALSFKAGAWIMLGSVIGYQHLGKICESAQRASEWLTNSAKVSFVYGLVPMVLHNLFSNDSNISKRLITKGFFGMHRNPFYAGAIGGLMLMTLENLARGLGSESPNYTSTIGFAVGAALVGLGLDSRRRLDEKGLEIKFGDEYRNYKERTNTYIPNPLRLFK